MRVTLYTDARGRGGAEISLGHLLAALPSGVEPEVLGVDAQVVGWVAGRRPGTPYDVLPERLGAHLSALRARAPDVLHVNRCTPWACATGLTAGLALPGARVVVVDQLPLRTTRAVELWRTRALTLRADAAVAVGAASARRIEDFYALGRGSVRSIPNLVPDLPDLPDPAGTPTPPTRRDGSLELGAVGRLDPVKGHDVLLRALARVAGARLTIVGSGGWREHLVRLADDLGVTDRVRFAGWVEEPRRLLASYDVVVLPSRSEGYPLTVVEAMLAARPVVATRVGAVPEAVRDGETGLLVDPGDVDGLAAALCRLRDDPGLRARLGRRGRELAAATMTAEHMAAAHVELWRAVRARPRAPRLRVPTPRP